MLQKRKDFQPLKSRSTTLIFISTLGNAIYFTLFMSNKILVSNYWNVWLQLGRQNPLIPKKQLYTNCEMQLMITWLAKPMFLAPYFFRAFRLRQIWYVSERSICEEVPSEAIQPKTFLLSERKVAIAMSIFLAPFCVLAILLTVMPKFAYIMPIFCVSQCQDATHEPYYQFINRTMLYDIVFVAATNVLFVACLWLLRKMNLTISAT
jgi:hypothetical protein